MKDRRTEKGFILALVMVVLAILTVFGMAMMMLSSASIETTGNVKAGQDAMNIAYNRFQRAQEDLLNESCVLNVAGAVSNSANNLLDQSSPRDGVDVHDLVAATTITCENVVASSPSSVVNKLGLGKLEIHGKLRSCENPKIARDHFLIRAIGELAGVKKVIEARVEYKSYLDYSFFQTGDLSFGDNVTIGGEVYVGGVLTLSTSGTGAHFKKEVYVGKSMAPSSWKSWGTFDKGVIVPYSKTLNMNVDAQLNHFYIEAQNCGWTIDASHGIECLGNGKADSSDGLEPSVVTHNLLEFSNFRNLDASSASIPPYYICATGSTYGTRYELPRNFDGIIFWNVSDRDLHVKGLLGVTESDNIARGKSILVVSQYTNIRVDSHIKTALDSRYQPVNIAFIVNKKGRKYIFGKLAPMLLWHQASFMVTKTGESDTTSPWQRNGSYASSVDSNAAFNATSTVDKLCGVPTSCSADINNNGNMTDTNAYGWNETRLVQKRTNILLNYGAIIVPRTGDAAMWHWDYPLNNGATTRLYHDDKDLLIYPPPFPKIKSLIHVVSYTEYDDN